VVLLWISGIGLRRMREDDYDRLSQGERQALALRSSCIRARLDLPPFLPDFFTDEERAALQKALPSIFQREH
jgi:hypothetical protein